MKNKIYKLKNLLEKKPIYGAGLKALLYGKYKYFRQSDIGDCPKTYVNKTLGKIMYKNDFFITRAGTIDTYFHDNDEEWVYAGYLVKYPINKKIALSKFIYFWSKGIGKKQILKNSVTGSTMPKFNPPIALNLKISLPSIEEQKKIIDIIEPKENFILKYFNCVRIDDFENTKNDVKYLIDIIEPLEKLENNINNINILIKKILKNYYLINKNEYIYLKNIIKLKNNKYKNQNKYFATNAFSEFYLENNKNIILNNKSIEPSRADLTPEKESFIISKMMGENKIYFFNKEPNYVVSTGFFNIKTKFIDHFSGFLLSKHFYNQKNIFSTGTTMISLTNNGLNSFKIKKPNNKFLFLTSKLEKFSNLKQKLNFLKQQLIKLLII